MKMSFVSSDIVKLFGEEKGYSIIKESGFDYIDFGQPCTLYSYKSGLYSESFDGFISYFKTQKKYIEGAGLKAGQIHSPFPTYPENGNKEEFDDMLRALKWSVFAASEVESPYAVIHCAMRNGWHPDTDPELTKKLNFEVFSILIPEAEKCGVTLALENMPSQGKPTDIPTSAPEQLIEYIDMMNSPNFKACFDTGHANVSGFGCGDYVKALGKRLVTLHIHDNDGTRDGHTCPTFGTVDWKDFFSSLSQVGYSGTLSLESDNFSDRENKLTYPLCVKFQHDILEELAREYM